MRTFLAISAAAAILFNQVLADPVPLTDAFTTFRWNGNDAVAQESFTIHLDAPARIQITDYKNRGDSFKVFDNEELLGETSQVESVQDEETYAATPEEALDDERYSKGTFDLGAGEHTITIKATGPYDAGTAAIRLIEDPSQSFAKKKSGKGGWDDDDDYDDWEGGKKGGKGGKKGGWDDDYDDDDWEGGKKGGKKGGWGDDYDDYEWEGGKGGWGDKKGGWDDDKKGGWGGKKNDWDDDKGWGGKKNDWDDDKGWGSKKYDWDDDKGWGGKKYDWEGKKDWDDGYYEGWEGKKDWKNGRAPWGGFDPDHTITLTRTRWVFEKPTAVPLYPVFPQPPVAPAPEPRK